MQNFTHIYTTPSSQWQSAAVSPGKNGVTPNLVLTDKRDQVWQGFGGCFNELGWHALSGLSNELKSSVMENLFKPGQECNFNFCRMPIGASDYASGWYSLNEKVDDFSMEHFNIDRDKGCLIPYIKTAQALQPGLKIFASPWSPPTWLKRPSTYNYGTLIMEKEYLEAYALYFLKFVQAYEAQGIHINQIHVQNEPMSTQIFPSCMLKGEQFRVFIRDYLGPLFEKNGVNTDIWLGTLNGPETDGRQMYTGYNDYAGLVLEDADARRFIKGVGYQWAGKYGLARTRMAWPHLGFMQTENECGDGTNTWAYAGYIFDLFHHYITGGVGAYIYWNMVLAPGGESTWGWTQNAMITADGKTGEVVYNPEYYVMRHFSQYIKPGSRRIVLEGVWCANTVAFENDDSTVIVVRNPFKEDKTLNIELNGSSMTFDIKAESVNTILI